jgi:hypothetical protein
MLGRLQMSIDECIKEYESLSRTIFAKYFVGDGVMQKGRILATGARFDSSILENAFKKFIGDRLGDPNARLLHEEGSCKVYVPLR